MLLLDTILLRPYVFVFFVIYAVACSLHLGVKRMILFCVAGYCIAWLSEFSSIHTGFPYGSYYYIEATRGREIWVLGVPLMDSISYVFLAYASYSLALLVAAPVRASGWTLYVLETRKTRNSGFVTLLAAILLVYLDIIIDPVALQGHHWFLGQIYGYPDGGLYFGVPLSNFAGWFLTGLLMVATLQQIDRLLEELHVQDSAGHRYAWRFMTGPLLYLSVVIFNLSIAFFIREHMMAWVGLFIMLLPMVLLYAIIRVKISNRDARDEWAEHLADFPLAGGGAECRVKRGVPDLS